LVPLIFEQVPGRTGPPAVPSPQEEPAPQLATPQHTPSVQNVPAEHVDDVVQATPRPIFGTQVLDAVSQKKPAAQNESLEHDVRHALGPQAYAPHEELVLGHTPAPLHFDAVVIVPTEQPAMPHAMVPAGAYVQLVRLVPLHVGPQEVPAPTPLHAARPPVGVPVTAVQVPAVPAPLHDSHWPVHAALQHTPSTQKFEEHCEFALHACPLLSAQTPAARPATAGALQTPFGQLAVVQQTLFTQYPVTHVCGLIGAAHEAPCA
jgi:hypothetical protein